MAFTLTCGGQFGAMLMDLCPKWQPLLLEQGSLCTIYHDLLHDSWYEQRA